MDSERIEEVVLSEQDRPLWIKRREELAVWAEREKKTLVPKRTRMFEGEEVDAELYECLRLLNAAGVRTEFSCAGVSMLDEPEDHSLYAYVTLHEGTQTRPFVDYALRRMGRRILVVWEPQRRRYDLSSFYIRHNRSFCLLLEACARDFAAGLPEQQPFITP
ncbi:hypothetical protein B9G55_16070 [Saccharibacillus sp. O16]|nr:hypothetical protein B9G55_16070 [Saccharibacillus sp. O16]